MTIPHPPNHSQPPHGGVEWSKVATGIVFALIFVAGLLSLAVSNSSSPNDAGATTTQQAMRPIEPPPVTPSPPSPEDPSALQPSLRFPSDRDTAVRLRGMSPGALGEALCMVDQQANPEITFGLLLRNPARFDRSLWVFNGRTIQVEDIQGETGSFLLVALDEYASQIVAVFTYLRPSDAVVEDRRVRVYGRVSETFTYNTRNGEERTVPKVLAVAVVPRNEVPRCGRHR